MGTSWHVQMKLKGSGKILIDILPTVSYKSQEHRHSKSIVHCRCQQRDHWFVHKLSYYCIVTAWVMNHAVTHLFHCGLDVLNFVSLR